MKFILIVMFVSYGNGSRMYPTNYGVAMQEFRNKLACEQAAKSITDTDPAKNIAAWCVLNEVYK